MSKYNSKFAWVFSTVLAGSFLITGCNKDEATPEKTESKPAVEAPKPAAPAAPAAAPAAPAAAPAAPAAAPAAAPSTAIDLSGLDLANGEQIYNKTCMACHLPGVANAPKLGDKAAWAPRLAKGLDALLNSGLNGIGTAMLPKGGSSNLSDDEVKNAVGFMVSKAQ